MSSTTPLLDLGSDLESTLSRLSIPAFALDDHLVVRWLNAAAVDTFGDLRGRSATQIVAPDERADVKRAVARKLIGVDQTTTVTRRIRTRQGWRTAEISSTPLANGGHVVGLFGIIRFVGEPQPDLGPRPAHLTPRQHEVLGLLARGLSTRQIADQLGLTVETVRNHVRYVLRGLDAHSRLQAVVRAHELGLV